MRLASPSFRLLALVGVLALPMVAQGQAQLPTGGTGAGDNQGGPETRLQKLGLSVDYYVSDSNSLNLVNNFNALYHQLNLGYAVGQKWLSGTPFSRLNVNLRLALNQTLTGYDPSAINPQDDLGRPVPCSNLTVRSGGRVDVSAVERCDRSSEISYRPTAADTWLSFGLPGVYKAPWGTSFGVTGRLVIPTSYESRYQTLRVGTTVLANGRQGFLGGKLGVSVTLFGTRNFHAYTTPGFDRSGPEMQSVPVVAGYGPSDVVSNTAGFLSDPSRLGAAGQTNTQWSNAELVSVDYSVNDEVSLFAMYMVSHAHGYALSCEAGTYGGQTTNACRNADTVAQRSNGVGTGDSVREGQMFYAQAGYQWTPWLNVSLQWTNASPLRTPTNTWRNPFISTDYNAFTSVGVGASFSLAPVL